MATTNSPHVLVVVLNYKGWQDSIACVESLAAQTYKNMKILLIENGSGDESDKKLSPLAAKYANLVYVQNSKNSGFTGGVNQGITYATKEGFDYVALFNNDAKADKDWLKYLVAAAQKHDSSITTGLLLSEDGTTIDDSGDFYTRWGIPTLRDEGKPRAEASESGWVFGATGGATLYSVELFTDIGLFDDVLFAYNEDVDISWRAQLAGYGAYYERRATAYHKHSATSKKIPGFTTTQVFQNLPVVYWKNVPGRLFFSVGWRFLLAYSMFYGYKITQGDIVPATRGVVRGLRLLPHALRERRVIQKNRRVTVAHIESLLLPSLPYKNIQRMRHFFMPWTK